MVKVFTKFSSIRYMYIRSHLYALFLTITILLALFLTVYVVTKPNWLTVPAIFMFIISYLIIGFFISLYESIHSSGTIIERLDHLTVQITQYANGNYQSKIYMNEKDEIARISHDLNELGERLQNQVNSLQRMADERADLAKTAHRAAAIEERQRIARDLHDSVSQQLFALTMLSEAAIQQISQNPEKAKKQLQEVAKAGLTAQTEMRALLLHLRPVYLSGDSLETGIWKLIDEMKQKTKLTFQVSMADGLSLPETTEEHVFRIVQEALANILRHANATEVRIAIAQRDKELFVHIHDNGEGFEVKDSSEHKASYGLQSMCERAEELGGTLYVKSSINSGTYIDVRIPLS